MNRESIMIIIKFYVEFSAEISVLGSLDPQKSCLEQIPLCMLCGPWASAKATGKSLFKIGQNLYFREEFMH